MKSQSLPAVSCLLLVLDRCTTARAWTASGNPAAVADGNAGINAGGDPSGADPRRATSPQGVARPYLAAACGQPLPLEVWQ